MRCLIEVHPNPAEALSDGAQQVSLEVFAKLMQELRPLILAAGRDDEEAELPSGNRENDQPRLGLGVRNFEGEALLGARHGILSPKWKPFSS